MNGLRGELSTAIDLGVVGQRWTADTRPPTETVAVAIVALGDGARMTILGFVVA